MSKFSLNSKYINNISSFSNSFTVLSNCMFDFVINNSFRITLPVVVASAVSSTVTRLLEIDQTTAELSIDIKSGTNIKPLVDKLQDVFQQKTVEIENDEEIRFFAEFGLAIGNDEFIAPMNSIIDRECKTLNEGNTLRSLAMKRTFGNKDFTKEIEFIAQNFDAFLSDNLFIRYSSDIDNLEVVNSIITCDKLHLDSEDSLMEYLLSVIKEANYDRRYFYLFDNVLLEYCSLDKCQEYLNFVNNVLAKQDLQSLISCIGKRLLQKSIPMKPNFIEKRHDRPHIKTSKENEMNGILKMENKKGNVNMISSSTYAGDIYSLISDVENPEFYTNSDEESYIEVSLKDKKEFVINSYSIRGRNASKDSGQLQNWVLEGQLSSNDKWISLDCHTSDPFDQFEVKTFDVKCNEKLKAVKLTQEGQNTFPNYHLIISGFEIYGTLYE